MPDRCGSRPLIVRGFRDPAARGYRWAADAAAFGKECAMAFSNPMRPPMV